MNYYSKIESNKITKSTHSIKNWFKNNAHSKEISSDKAYPFNFKKSNWYITAIYLISFIVVPIIYSLVKRYGFNIIVSDSNTEPQPWVTLDLIFTYLIPILGMVLTFAFDWKIMVKEGGWAAYSHFIFGFISVVFVSLFLVGTDVIKADAKDPMFLAVSFFCQIIFQFIGSVLVLLSSKQLRTQIWTTLKEAKLDLLIWVVVFFAVATLLTYMFNAISTTYQTAASNSSANQSQLELMTKTSFGVFAFILGTVFFAPVNEEISYRYGTFSITRSKWLGFVASLIYFPAMHILDAGDWNNILSYLGMAIILPSLFVFTRGNTTYTIGTHMLWNAIAAIAFLVTMK